MSLGSDYLNDYAYEIYHLQEEEKVCGDCRYFQLTSYPLFIGRGECVNPKSEYCFENAWIDDCACEEFIADMRGGNNDT